MIWALIVCSGGLRFVAHPYAWMKAWNLLASLASLSLEYLALARSVCPDRLLLPLAASMLSDGSRVLFSAFICSQHCSVCAVQRDVL